MKLCDNNTTANENYQFSIHSASWRIQSIIPDAIIGASNEIILKSLEI
jgi:hypothetical protein